MSAKVLITGGSGLIGTRLTQLLLERKYEVTHLGRSHQSGSVKSYLWDPSKGEIDAKAISETDAVIHLAGASIAGKRWTAAYKRELLDSRVQSTKLLYESIRSIESKPLTFISASAIGYYGTAPRDGALAEEDAVGNDFLAGLVKEWETEVSKIADLGLRVCMIRTGIVLSADGGALPQMSTPIRFGFGAPLGTGQQIISWVHIDDICRAYIYLLENVLHGAFNVAAPHPVTNAELTAALARRLRRPLWLPNIPGGVLKILLGEMAEAILTGNRISSEKITAKGFTFLHKNIDEALADLLKSDTR